MATNSPDFTDATLAETPNDVTSFLDGIGAEPEIRDTLYSVGMTDEDIIEGRNLLMATLAEPRGTAPVVDDEASRIQRAAVAELDNWDEPHFQCYKAALTRRAPGAAEYVFGDLTASRGAQSVQGVATFLARVDHLENGTDPTRKEFKKDDKKAVALLERRGLTPEERKRLRKLVEVAFGPTGAAIPPKVVIDPQQRRERLLALKLWYNEWATTAHAVIRKRNYLIRLGLANRRVAKKDATPETPVS